MSRKPDLKLIVNDNPIKKSCNHSVISVIAISSKDKILGYKCDKCLKIFKREQVGICADAFGYVDYYAISD